MRIFASLRYLLSLCCQPVRIQSAVHIPQRPRTHIFTCLHPRPKLPARPSCDSLPVFTASCSPLQHLFSSHLLFLSLKPSKLPKSSPRNPLFLRKLKTPHKSSSSRPATASKPTATAARKSTRVSTSAPNSA